MAVDVYVYEMYITNEDSASRTGTSRTVLSIRKTYWSMAVCLGVLRAFRNRSGP